MIKKLLLTLSMTAGLILSACQPQAQPSAAQAPVKPADTSIDTSADTSQPVKTSLKPTATRIPFNYPTDTVRPPAPTVESGLSVQWTFKTGGAIWGNPTVDQGVIYTGSDDGNLYAVDAKTGQMLWKFATRGIVRSCPAVMNGLVYIASDDGYLYAIQAQDGKRVWKTDIGNALPREKRVDLGNSPSPTGWDYLQSSPVVADGLVYAGSLDGKVYALGAADGQVAWTFKTGDKVRATPVIDNGVVYIGSWDMKSYAIDAKTGQALWDAPVSGQVQTTALVVDGLVIIASRKASVQALDMDTGERVWEYDYGPNLWVESSPRLDGDRIVIGSSGSNIVVAIELKTGKLAWMFSSESFNWSTPLAVKDTIYVGGATFQNPENSGMLVLHVTDKNLPFHNVTRRVFTVADTLESSGNIYGVAGSPVLVDGILYFGALDGKLYAVKD